MEEASTAIGAETRETEAEKAEWVRQAAGIDERIAELTRQLEAQRAEAARCAAQVARCDAAVAAVHSKYGKSIKRLQTKQEALATSKEACLKVDAPIAALRTRPTSPRAPTHPCLHPCPHPTAGAARAPGDSGAPRGRSSGDGRHSGAPRHVDCAGSRGQRGGG